RSSFASIGSAETPLIQPPRPTKFMYMVAALSAIGGFLFGYDTGVISGALIQIKRYFNLSEFYQELVVGITVAGAWLFSLLAGVLTERLGRKPVVLIASAVFSMGAFLMGFAVNRGMLLIGRLIVGAG